MAARYGRKAGWELARHSPSACPYLPSDPYRILSCPYPSAKAEWMLEVLLQEDGYQPRSKHLYPKSKVLSIFLRQFLTVGKSAGNFLSGECLVALLAENNGRVLHIHSAFRATHSINGNIHFFRSAIVSPLG